MAIIPFLPVNILSSSILYLNIGRLFIMAETEKVPGHLADCQTLIVRIKLIHRR